MIIQAYVCMDFKILYIVNLDPDFGLQSLYPNGIQGLL
jgi:hypothetical protein